MSCVVSAVSGSEGQERVDVQFSTGEGLHGLTRADLMFPPNESDIDQTDKVVTRVQSRWRAHRVQKKGLLGSRTLSRRRDGAASAQFAAAPSPIVTVHATISINR